MTADNDLDHTVNSPEEHSEISATFMVRLLTVRIG